ncbi:hypothetical protein J6590_015522 [Homalodisca vitripennis]|nr:hypothetical protein J6590_015522 [Homalodisca vitripennis]
MHQFKPQHNAPRPPFFTHEENNFMNSIFVRAIQAAVTSRLNSYCRHKQYPQRRCRLSEVLNSRNKSKLVKPLHSAANNSRKFAVSKGHASAISRICAQL